MADFTQQPNYTQQPNVWTNYAPYGLDLDKFAEIYPDYFASYQQQQQTPPAQGVLGGGRPFTWGLPQTQNVTQGAGIGPIAGSGFDYSIPQAFIDATNPTPPAPPVVPVPEPTPVVPAVPSTGRSSRPSSRRRSSSSDSLSSKRRTSRGRGRVGSKGSSSVRSRARA